jgi:hypothetical protein
VILRSQQATKNLHLLENSNADPSLLLKMTGWGAFFRTLPEAGRRAFHFCLLTFAF